MMQHWFAPEYVPDSDVRMIQDYNDILNKVHGICSSHIQHGIKSENAKQKSTEIVWKIYHHVERVLSELGEIKTIEVKNE